MITSSKIRYATKIGMLAAIAFVLMYLDFPLPFFPAWLKLDISDVPAMLGSLAMGPVAGIFIEAVKNILYILLKGTSSGGVGEIANFTLGCILIVPAGIIYKRDKTRKAAVIGILAGIACFAVVGAVINAYILLPLFAKLFSIEAIMKMAQAVNVGMDSFEKIAIYAVIPFNVMKGVIVLVITMLIYKRMSPLLHR